VGAGSVLPVTTAASHVVSRTSAVTAYRIIGRSRGTAGSWLGIAGSRVVIVGVDTESACSGLGTAGNGSGLPVIGSGLPVISSHPPLDIAQRPLRQGRGALRPRHRPSPLPRSGAPAAPAAPALSRRGGALARRLRRGGGSGEGRCLPPGP